MSDSLGDKFKFWVCCLLIILGLLTPLTFMAGQHYVNGTATVVTDSSGEYYRGAYDVCVMAAQQNSSGPVTSTIISQCNKFVASAKSSDWAGQGSTGYIK